MTRSLWPLLAVVATLGVGCMSATPPPMSTPSQPTTPPTPPPTSDAPPASPVSPAPGAAAPAPSKPSLLEGTASYRERVALPADATLEVWITDTSPGIVTMAVLGEVAVQMAGRQVPVPFQVALDPARVDAAHSYGVRAVIRAGGETLFETPAPVPVLTQGNPTNVSLTLQRPASEAPAAASVASLVGTSWRLVDLAGTPAVDKAEATLEFPEAGRAAGRGSCNRFFGPVTIEGSRITFGALAATRMACADAAANAQETRYLAALGDAERYDVQGDMLRVHVKGETAPLRFTRVAP